MKSRDLLVESWIPWMRRALQLAELGDGQTSPNPLVGAVVLDSKGNIVGEGYHTCAGAAHAEVNALEQAGSRADGGSLIVTLEPCCHLGKTPPCTEAILKSGVSCVVVALEDPDPRVSGKGLSLLEASGLKVVKGVLSAEASFQNRAFLHRVSTGRPWGILKWAMSLDGRIALPNGSSKWITGGDARGWVHHLRAKCDAVITGGGTLRNDDPLLTSRGKRNPEPLRVVLTQSLNLPRKANLWNTSFAKTVLAYSEKELGNGKTLPDGPESLLLSAAEPSCLLEALAQRGCNKVLWECGPSLATAAIKQECVQELVVVVGPKLLGGELAKTPLGDFSFSNMKQVFSLDLPSAQKYGNDWLFETLLVHQ